MTETMIYLVRRTGPDRHRVVKSAWWTEGEALAEAERIANEDARETGETSSRPIRVQVEGRVTRKFLIQEQMRVPTDDLAWASHRTTWHTLRHYSVFPVGVRGNVVHRLAELVS